jgi:hypothetical protein
MPSPGIKTNLGLLSSTTRTLSVAMVSPAGADLTNDLYMPSVEWEDAGSSAQGTFSGNLIGNLATFPTVADEARIEVYDHTVGDIVFRGFIKSRRPELIPGGPQGPFATVAITAEYHHSILDNYIPSEIRPAGESDKARIGYLWGLYATGVLAADLTYVTQVDSNMPAQAFIGLSLRQALDLIAAQATGDLSWYLDPAGRLHYFATESNAAPYAITS